MVIFLIHLCFVKFGLCFDYSIHQIFLDVAIRIIFKIDILIRYSSALLSVAYMELEHHDMQNLLIDNLGKRVSLMLTSGAEVNGIIYEISDPGFILMQKVCSGFECRDSEDMCNDVIIPMDTVIGLMFYTGRMRRGVISKEWVSEDGVSHSSSKEVKKWVDVEFKDGKFVDTVTPVEENVRWLDGD
jgi:hypothetical protein